MKAPISNVTEVDFPSDLFVRYPLALNPVQARLFALALGSLDQASQQLTFQLAFRDVIQGGNACGQQYKELVVAQTRLTRPLKIQTLREGNVCSQYLPLFIILSLDENTALITGEFNPYLKAYWLELRGVLTPTELGSLLMRR